MVLSFEVEFVVLEPPDTQFALSETVKETVIPGCVLEYMGVSVAFDRLLQYLALC